MTDRPNNQDASVADSVHPGEEELSAYINGDITDLEELQRLQAHLATCAGCREMLSELRAVVWLLRGAENPVPSRSFRLDPSMVRAPVVQIDPWIVRIQPALRRLTALAAVVLFILVAADVLVHQNAREGGTQSVAVMSSVSQSSSGSTAAGPALIAGGSANSEAQPAAATPAAASAPADTAKTSEAGTPVAGVEAQPALTVQSQPEQSPTSNSVEPPGRSYWRLIELAAGVVVIWLLFLTVALPRLVRQREP